MKYIPGTLTFVVLVLVAGNILRSCDIRERNKPAGPPWTLIKSDDDRWNYTGSIGEVYDPMRTFDTREKAEEAMRKSREFFKSYDEASARKYTPVTE